MYHYYYTDHVLEKAEKRKLEVTASSIFDRDHKRWRTNGSLDNLRDGVGNGTRSAAAAQLGTLAAVHTKLKMDPFLANAGFGRVDDEMGDRGAAMTSGLAGLVRVVKRAKTETKDDEKVKRPASLSGLVSLEYGDNDDEEED